MWKFQGLVGLRKAAKKAGAIRSQRRRPGTILIITCALFGVGAKKSCSDTAVNNTIILQRSGAFWVQE